MYIVCFKIEVVQSKLLLSSTRKRFANECKINLSLLLLNVESSCQVINRSVVDFTVQICGCSPPVEVILSLSAGD